jgi:hypothetical protein
MELFNYAVILPFSLFVFSLEMQPFLMCCGSSLRHCATVRKVAVSISNGVVGIFHWHNTFGRTMTMGSTHPLKEMSTRNIFCGIKSARALGWQHYHFRVPTVMKSGKSQSLSGPVQGFLEFCVFISFRCIRFEYFFVIDPYINVVAKRVV